MQLNTLIRHFNNCLFLSTRQTTPAITQHHALRLHTAAVLNDAGDVTKSPTLERPKRPINAYIRFVQNIRGSLVSSNPNASPTEISKLAAAQWQKLDQSAKVKLEEEYKKDQAVWLQKNAKYLSQLTDSQKAEMKLARQKKVEEKEKRDAKRMMQDLGRPKRPLNGYLFFCARNRPKAGLSQEDNKLQMKSLGNQWQRLSPEEKERYNKEAEEDKKRYHAAMKEWEDKMLVADKMDAVRKKNQLLPPSSSSGRGASASKAATKPGRPASTPRP